MRPVRIYAPKQTPCLPYAPRVEDAEQSASSQPTPSRRKPCPAPAVAEPATTSPQFPGQCVTRHCALIITNPGLRKSGSISGRTRIHASAAALPHFTVRSLASAPRGSRRPRLPQSCGRSGARPLHLLRVSFGTVCSPLGWSGEECTASLENKRCCPCLL
jgi:hypothetical protein